MLIKKQIRKRISKLFIFIFILSSLSIINIQSASAVSLAANETFYQNCKVVTSYGRNTNGKIWAMAKANNPSCTVQLSIEYRPDWTGSTMKEDFTPFGNTIGRESLYSAKIKSFWKYSLTGVHIGINATYRATVNAKVCAGGFGCGPKIMVADLYQPNPDIIFIAWRDYQ